MLWTVASVRYRVRHEDGEPESLRYGRRVGVILRAAVPRGEAENGARVLARLLVFLDAFVARRLRRALSGRCPMV